MSNTKTIEPTVLNKKEFRGTAANSVYVGRPSIWEIRSLSGETAHAMRSSRNTRPGSCSIRRCSRSSTA